MKIYVDELPEFPDTDCLFYTYKEYERGCILFECDCSNGTCPLVVLDPQTDKGDAV